MKIKRTIMLVSAVAITAYAFASISAAAETPLTPAWSADFENIITENGAVTVITPNIGNAAVVESGNGMTTETSYDGSTALRINKGDYLTITKDDGNAPVTASDTGITVSYWVKVYSNTSWGFFESKAGIKGARNYFGVIDNSNDLSWETQAGKKTGLKKSGLSLNDWHMITVTYGNSGSYIYADGSVVEASLIDTSPSNTEPYPYGSMNDIIGENPVAYIGYASDWGEHADIAVDDYRVYNEQLSDEQVKELYDKDTAIAVGTTSEGKTIYISGEEDLRTLTSVGGALAGGTVELIDCDITLTSRWDPQNITVKGEGSITMANVDYPCQPTGDFTVDGEIAIKSSRETINSRKDAALGVKNCNMTIKGGAEVDGIEVEGDRTLTVENASVGTIITRAYEDKNIDFSAKIDIQSGAKIDTLRYARGADSVTISDNASVENTEVYVKTITGKLEKANWSVDGQALEYKANGNELTNDNITIYGYKASIQGDGDYTYRTVKASVSTVDGEIGEKIFNTTELTGVGAAVFYVLSDKALNTDKSFVTAEQGGM